MEADGQAFQDQAMFYVNMMWTVGLGTFVVMVFANAIKFGGWRQDAFSVAIAFVFAVPVALVEAVIGGFLWPLTLAFTAFLIAKRLFSGHHREQPAPPIFHPSAPPRVEHDWRETL